MLCLAFQLFDHPSVLDYRDAAAAVDMMLQQVQSQEAARGSVEQLRDSDDTIYVVPSSDEMLSPVRATVASSLWQDEAVP